MMNRFGTIKSKILEKFAHLYINEDKASMKNLLKKINENNNFKEMYVFYEDIENKYFDDDESARLYIQEIENILKQKSDKLNDFLKSMNVMLKNINIVENEVYNYLDDLSVNDTFKNLDKKIIAKKKLLEHLTKKKDIVENSVSTVVNNQKLLNNVLSNDFNVEFNLSLNENEKNELNEILSMSNAEISEKIESIKKGVLEKVDLILKETLEDTDKEKLNLVINEVSTMIHTKTNYYRLKQLDLGFS